jgi:hypothetical protein
MNENISILEAFKHCASTGSYWLWIAIAVVIFIGGFIGLKKSYDKEGWSTGKNFVLFVLIALLLSSILARPADIAANTTKEQAARGVYIGY